EDIAVNVDPELFEEIPFVRGYKRLSPAHRRCPLGLGLQLLRGESFLAGQPPLTPYRALVVAHCKHLLSDNACTLYPTRANCKHSFSIDACREPATMDSILSAPYFHSEEAAYEFVEKRLWPHGPVCPKCGSISDKHYRLKGKSTRVGVWKCRDCRKPFRVTVGTD